MVNDRGTPLGRVSSLQVYSARKAPAERPAVVYVIEDLGLDGNHRSKPGSDRQVLLLEGETLGRLGIEPGTLRENITTEGIDLHALGRGSQLKVGDDVILEITQYCTPCRRVEEVRPGLTKEIKNRRGMLARVIAGGAVKTGDLIEVLRFKEPIRSKLPC